MVVAFTDYSQLLAHAIYCTIYLCKAKTYCNVKKWIIFTTWICEL